MSSCRSNARIEIEVLPDLCAASGYCVRIAREVFEQGDQGLASVRPDYLYSLDAALLTALEDAVVTCPSGAIRVTREVE